MNIIKAIDDRYKPEKRNPFNEVEYGNYYTRAMSSYGAFVAASGFTYHGPKGKIGFNPKINPEKFKWAFITADGWGTYSQTIEGGKQNHSIELKYSLLDLNEFELKAVKDVVEVLVNGQATNEFTYDKKTGNVSIFVDEILKKGEELIIQIN